MKEVTPEAKRYARELMRLAVDMLRNPFYIARKKNKHAVHVKIAELIERGWAIAHGDPDPYPPPPPTGEFKKRLRQVTIEELKEAAKKSYGIEPEQPNCSPIPERNKVESAWCEKCQLYHAVGVSVCPHQQAEEQAHDAL